VCYGPAGRRNLMGCAHKIVTALQAEFSQFFKIFHQKISRETVVKRSSSPLRGSSLNLGLRPRFFPNHWRPKGASALEITPCTIKNTHSVFLLVQGWSREKNIHSVFLLVQGWSREKNIHSVFLLVQGWYKAVS